MAEIIAIGNQYKPSGVPQLEYDQPRPDILHADVDPKILIAHVV
jgi:hypothetical protein